MTAQSLAIRKKLHQFIDTVEEKKLKAMYTIFESEIEYEHNEEFYSMLNERHEEYKRTGISISEKEVNKSARNLLRTKKK